MSLAPTTPIPAGWYPDPQGSFQQRWWNGTSWTNEFAQYRPSLNYTPAVQLAVEQATPAQIAAAAQVAAAQSAYAAAQAAAAALEGTPATQARYVPQYGAVQTFSATEAYGADQTNSGASSTTTATITLEPESVRAGGAGETTTTFADTVVTGPVNAGPVNAGPVNTGPAQAPHVPQHAAPQEEAARGSAPADTALEAHPGVHRAVEAPAAPQAPVQPAAVQYAPIPAPIPQFAPVPQQAAGMAAPHPSFAGQGYGAVPTPAAATRPSASSASLIASNPTTPHLQTGAVNPSIQEAYQPFGMIPAVRTGVRDRPEKRHTAAVVLLAIFPIIPIAAALALAFYVPESYTLFAQGGLAIVLIAGLLGLALSDRRRLLDSGHEAAASPVLALIPPVYFIARTVVVSRETGRGSPLPLVLAVLVLLGIAAAFVVEPTLGTLLITSN